MDSKVSKFIIVEGIDRSGKTTFAKKLNELTNFQHYISDRSVISHFCYGKIYERDIDFKFMQNVLERLRDHLIIIYLRPEKDVIKKRLADTKHEYIDIDKDLASFDSIMTVLDRNNFRVILADEKTNVEEFIQNEGL